MLPKPEGAELIRAYDVSAIEEPSNGALVFPLARLVAGSSSISITRVEIGGRHRTLRTPRSVRVYYVLCGALHFMLDGDEPVTVAAEDTLVIPPGCWYSLEGRATYLVINCPAFEDGDDEYAE